MRLKLAVVPQRRRERVAAMYVARPSDVLPVQPQLADAVDAVQHYLVVVPTRSRTTATGSPPTPYCSASTARPPATDTLSRYSRTTGRPAVPSILSRAVTR